MTTTGGDRLKAAIRKAREGSPIEGVEVGYFADSEYAEQGTPVAEIANANEFGTATIPERPFMRRAIRNSEENVRELIAGNIDGESGAPTLALAEQVGETVKSAIQREITELRDPPNSPATVAAKKSSNPLLDTGHLRASTRYRIIRR